MLELIIGLVIGFLIGYFCKPQVQIGGSNNSQTMDRK